MTRKKYKATGCARFLLVLLILIPAAYFGAKAIRGGEGIPVIDNFIDSVFKTDEQGAVKSIDDTMNDKIEKLQEENRELKKRIEELERQLKAEEASPVN